MDLQKIVQDARIQAQKEQIEHERQMREMGRQSRLWRMERETFIEKYLSQTNATEYRDWLKGYLENGGQITDVYDYPFAEDKFFMASRDIPLVPKLCGAVAINIIVPKGIEVPRLEGHMPYGHCHMYFMDDFTVFGGDYVPLYSDIDF